MIKYVNKVHFNAANLGEYIGFKRTDRTFVAILNETGSCSSAAFSFRLDS